MNLAAFGGLVFDLVQPWGYQHTIGFNNFLQTSIDISLIDKIERIDQNVSICEARVGIGEGSWIQFFGGIDTVWSNPWSSISILEECKYTDGRIRLKENTYLAPASSWSPRWSNIARNASIPESLPWFSLASKSIKQSNKKIEVRWSSYLSLSHIVSYLSSACRHNRYCRLETSFWIDRFQKFATDNRPQINTGFFFFLFLFPFAHEAANLGLTELHRCNEKQISGPPRATAGNAVHDDDDGVRGTASLKSPRRTVLDSSLTDLSYLNHLWLCFTIVNKSSMRQWNGYFSLTEFKARFDKERFRGENRGNRE